MIAVGRRALRKIDPSLDLSKHLLEFEQLPRPWSAAALFGRVAPLEIEVGSGKGLFLRNAARSQPDVDFLGIEIAHKYARFAAAGLAKAGLDQRPGRVGRRHADLRRVDPRRLAGRRPRLLSRSLVEEAAPQAARDERDLHRDMSSGRSCRAARCTSGPTLRSIFRRRWNSWPPTRGSAGRSPCRKRPPSTTWPIARISSGGCGSATSRSIGRSSGREFRKAAPSAIRSFGV